MKSENKAPVGMQIFRKIVLNKIFIAAVCVVLAYTLIGFFLTPYLIKRQLTRFTARDLQRRIQIQSVRVNPYTFTLAVQGFSLMEQDDTPLLGFSELFANFEAVSLFNWAWTFAEVRFDDLRVNLQINRQGDLNLIRLLSALPEKEQEQKADNKPPRLLFQKIAINNGQIAFEDLQGPTPANVTLRSVSLELSDMSTLPEHEGPFTITARAADGETLSCKGTITLDPLQSDGAIRLSNLKADQLWEFVYDQVNCDVASGSLDWEGRYHFAYSEQKLQLLMEDVRTRISGLVLKPRNAEASFLNLNEALLENTRFDLAAQTLELGHLKLQGGSLDVQVDTGGSLNWQKFFSPPSGHDSDEPALRAQGAGAPWQIGLNAADIGGFSVHFRDNSRLRPVEASLGDQTLNFAAILKLNHQGTQVIIQDIAASLEEIELKETAVADPLLNIKRFLVSGGLVNLQERSLSAEQATIEGGDMRVKIDAQHNINWVQLSGARDPGLISRSADKALDQAEAQGRPWGFAVASVRLSDFHAGISDESTAPAAMMKLQDIQVDLADVTSDPEKPMQFKAELTVNEDGRFSTRGELFALRPALDADLQWQQLALTPLQPYMNKYASLVIESGRLHGNGRLRYGGGDANSRLNFEGGLRLTDLSILESESRKLFLGWSAFEVPELRFTTAPNNLETGEIRMVEPTGKFIIFKDKSINLSKILKHKSPPPVLPATAETREKSSVEKPAFAFAIERIQVEKGNLDFADLSLILPFSVRINELNGVVNGIRADAQSRTSMKLEGRVDEYGLARVEGSLLPFDPKNFTDITTIFRNVEMTNLTPYTATFAGYKIASGKLSLDLQYKIQSGKLMGENAILLDQLVLGERVKSPDAPDLPLEMAIALLKDQNGKINLAIPVSGDVENPDFSYGKLILKAMSNLVTNIVAAPFKLIGAMLGVKDKELDTIEFDPGSDKLLPPEQEKLKHVADALKKRPQLRLEVIGKYEPDMDGAVLKTRALRREVAARSGMKLKSGEDPGPIDFANPQNQTALESLFVAQTSPETLVGLRGDYDKALAEKKAAAKSKKPPGQPPTGEFHAQLFTRLEQKWPLGKDALAMLARSRAEKIGQAITQTGGVESARVVIKNPVKAEKVSKKLIPAQLEVGVHE